MATFKREKVVRSAEKYVAKGKLEAAIKEYRKVLRENPNDTNTLNRVGDLYARLERYDEAVRLFSQIAEKYTEEGFFVKAIAIYKKIIKFDPSALSVYERLGDLYHRQGLTNEARSQYQFLADYYTKNDNHTSATTVYQRLAEIEPDNPSHKLKLAELYESQRLLEKSAREYHGLAELLLDGDSPDDAVEFFAKALELQPDDVALVRLGVGALHDKGHMGAAANLLAKAVELNPEAQAVAEEIGLGEAGEEAEAGAEEDETAPGTADETFEVGEEELADFDEEAAEAMAAVDAASDEDFAGGFTEDETVASPSAAEAADEEVAGREIAGQEIELDVDLEVELEEEAEPVEAATEGATEAGEAPEEPEEFELDVDFGDMADFGVGEEAEPVEAADLGDVELEVEIEEPVEAAAEAPPETAPETEESDEPPPVRREEDLLAEAKVFGKYGLESKAHDRLEELLESNPEHLEALLMATRMELDDGDAEAAVAYAERMRDASHAAGETDLWNELRGDLAAHGITVEDKAPVPAEEVEEAEEEAAEEVPVAEAEPEPAPAPVEEEPAPAAPERSAPEPVAPEPSVEEPSEEPEATPAAAAAPSAPKKRKSSDRIAQLLEDLSLDSFDAPTERRKKRVAPPAEEEAAPKPAPAEAEPAETGPEETEPAAAPAAETPGVETPQPEPQPKPEPEPEPAAAEATATEPAPAGAEEGGLFSLKDELDLGDVVDHEDVVAAEPLEAAAAAPSLDDSGMSWLDEEEPAAAETAAPADADEDLFDEEDDFFDLAAELEQELGAEELAKVDAGTSSLESQEGSLEDIIEGFKKGVSDHLSEEDFDTHFNLGIAYREMGLLDEAIGEFQLASKDPRYLAECASMLGMCFNEKGLPQLAVRWYKKGLDADELSEDATLGLLYDLGNAYVSLGEPESAYRTFVEIYGMNTGFRDVAAKMEELAPQGQA